MKISETQHIRKEGIGKGKVRRNPKKGGTKTYHRKYPDSKWDYKAVSTRIDGKEIIYYTLISKGKRSEGIEIYQGANYDPSSSARSYSRRYDINKIPAKYERTASMLKSKHGRTRWSKKSRVDLD